MPNEDRWKKLQEIKVVRKTPVEKKLDNITKVIHDPDEFNVNICLLYTSPSPRDS